QEAVPQLVTDESHQHGPGHFVAPAHAHHVVLLDLNDLGVLGIHARNPGPEQHAIAPVGDPRDPEQPAHTIEGLPDQVLSRGVLAAPGTPIHPVIHAAGTARAAALELVFLVPLLILAAPGAVRHGILHAAAAAPVAARIHAEPLRGLERRLTEGALV